MADSQGAPPAIAKAGGALFALVYVLPLTGAALFATAMAPALLPTGWPSGILPQLRACLVVSLPIAMLLSVMVLWYLIVGYLRAGAGWVLSRSRWLRWGALMAPLTLVWSISRRSYLFYRHSLTATAREMGDAFWTHQFSINALYLGWSLLFLAWIALLRFPPKRRTL
jgi:hypothetical protein